MPKTATRAPRKPSAAQEAAKANREREKDYKDKVLARAMKRRARAWYVRLLLWFLLRIAPISFTTALFIRDDFRTIVWALFCTVVPVDMIPFLAPLVPAP